MFQAALLSSDGAAAWFGRSFSSVCRALLGVRMLVDWPALLRNPPRELRVSHDIGSADAEEASLGRRLLTLGPEGDVRLEQWHRFGTHRVWTTRIDLETARRFLRLLADSGFPSTSLAAADAKAAVRVLSVRHKDASAQASFVVADVAPKSALAELSELADRLCEQVQGKKRS